MTARRKPTIGRSSSRQTPPSPRTRARRPKPDSEPVSSPRAPQSPVATTTAPGAEHIHLADGRYQADAGHHQSSDRSKSAARLCRLVLSLLEATGAVANTPEVQRLRDDIRAEICAVEGSTYEPR